MAKVMSALEVRGRGGRGGYSGRGNFNSGGGGRGGFNSGGAHNYGFHHGDLPRTLAVIDRSAAPKPQHKNWHRA
ncbi:hypothetical protein NW761_006749 [Fusarium oxysporum]|nr:hypothetical protein Forpi1262_v010717 [Fusarium oxysporum f. sp. raphani]KAJ4026150.1 hypothetical protein NW758_014270 [Fusarium oxysporum]WKT52177.1 hypothetical protein QSH57_002691 [Fusarium oxysporum f. sp. vasinfectum]KAJ4029414.1 hypothetical protein NW753_014234 [Fusarium oxysporum]KAJ4050155.1 hypothetical protein NW763_009489 [Fusarium oxysporum]